MLAPGYPVTVPVAVAFPRRLPLQAAIALDPLSAQWLARGALDGLSPATLRSYIADLRAFLAWAAGRSITNWHQLDEPVLCAFLTDQYASGIGRRLAARRAGVLASVLDFGRELGHPLERILHRPRSHRVLPATVEPQAIARVIACTRGDGYFGARDRCILDLLYSTGIKAAEACALDIDHIDLSAGLLDVRAGRRFRRVPVADAALSHVRAWLTMRRPAPAAARALLLAADGRRLQPDGLLLICHRRSVSAGQVPRLSPRIIRNSCAVHLLERGASRQHVAAMMGLSLSQIDQISRAAAPRSPKTKP